LKVDNLVVRKVEMRVVVKADLMVGGKA